MEDLKLLMDDMMKERNRIDILTQRTEVLREGENDLIAAYNLLCKKHNKLCKSVALLGLACLGLDVLIILNAIDISKIKEKQNKEKEG